jgi:hypothetical protein
MAKEKRKKLAMVIFSGDMDKLLAIIDRNSYSPMILTSTLFFLRPSNSP